MTPVSEPQFQRICQEWADKHILYNQTALVELMMSENGHPDFSIDNVENWVADEETEELPDILEWHLIDIHAEHWLRKKGEPILSNEFGTWWGRTTSGQAVIMDEVIRSIVRELNSLTIN